MARQALPNESLRWWLYTDTDMIGEPVEQFHPQDLTLQLIPSMRSNAIVNGGAPLRRGMMVMGRITSILPTRRTKSAITAQRLEVGWIWFHKGEFLRTCGESGPDDRR